MRERLQQRGRLPVGEWVDVKSTADQLLALSIQRFEEIAGNLRIEIGSLNRDFTFSARGGEHQPHYLLYTAYHHTADFREYDAGAELCLDAGQPDNIVLSFHGIGPRFRGLIGIAAWLVIAGRLIPIEEGSYQINYAEDGVHALARFAPWLDRVIVRGLNEWRKTL